MYLLEDHKQLFSLASALVVKDKGLAAQIGLFRKVLGIKVQDDQTREKFENLAKLIDEYRITRNLYVHSRWWITQGVELHETANISETKWRWKKDPESLGTFQCEQVSLSDLETFLAKLGDFQSEWTTAVKDYKHGVDKGV